MFSGEPSMVTSTADAGAAASALSARHAPTTADQRPAVLPGCVR
jgi:hypothetical protein